MIPDASDCDCYVRLYVKDLRTDSVYQGERKRCERGMWEDLTFRIPAMEGALLGEAGFLFEVVCGKGDAPALSAFVDDLVFSGAADYKLDFARENIEFWNISHQDVSQMTCLKGHIFLQDSMLHISCSDYMRSNLSRERSTSCWHGCREPAGAMLLALTARVGYPF